MPARRYCSWKPRRAPSRPPIFARGLHRAHRSTGSCPRPWRNTFARITSTERQTTGMAKTDVKRKATPRLPRAVAGAVRAARDKQAVDVVVLDLRKAGAFTDYFVICTGQNPRP